MSLYQRDGKWRAQVRFNRKSHGMYSASGTFATKAKARAWMSEQEQNYLNRSTNQIPNKPLGDLLNKYIKEVSSTKRGYVRERNMINVLLRDPLADVMLPDLTSSDVSAWRDRRLRTVTGSTVCREMNILSHAFNTAKKEWRWLKENPCSDVARPKESAARTRRPTSNEIELLRLVMTDDVNRKSGRVFICFLFAIETAMRAGEIANLKWQDVNSNYVHIAKTKNGYPRDVPMSTVAKEIIENMRDQKEKSEFVFNIKAASIDALFRKYKTKSMIDDLHFHDSRREALTRLAKIYNVMELAKISGHRDLRILQNVYYAPSVQDLAAKLP